MISFSSQPTLLLEGISSTGSTVHPIPPTIAADILSSRPRTPCYFPPCLYPIAREQKPFWRTPVRTQTLQRIPHGVRDSWMPQERKNAPATVYSRGSILFRPPSSTPSKPIDEPNEYQAAATFQSRRNTHRPRSSSTSFGTFQIRHHRTSNSSFIRADRSLPPANASPNARVEPTARASPISLATHC